MAEQNSNVHDGTHDADGDDEDVIIIMKLARVICPSFHTTPVPLLFPLQYLLR